MTEKLGKGRELFMDDLLVSYIKTISEIENNPDLTEKERLVYVVLNVKGTVITGELISFQTYRNEQARFENKLSELIKPLAKDEQFENENYFIHLRNACFLVDSRLTISFPGKGLLWRGRLSSVDGFAIGKLQTNEVSDPPLRAPYTAPYRD